MNNWKEENQALEKTYVFDSFEDAIQFLQLQAGANQKISVLVGFHVFLIKGELQC